MKITFEDLKKELTDLKSKGQNTISVDDLLTHFVILEQNYNQKEKDALSNEVESFAKEKVENEKRFNQ
jgi:hypothetical protein